MKKNKFFTAKRLIAPGIALLIILGAVLSVYLSIKNGEAEIMITAEEAQKLVNEDFDALAVTDPLKIVAEANHIKVDSVSYGIEKDVILECTVSTLDVYSSVSANYDDFMGASLKNDSGMYKSEIKFKVEFNKRMSELVSEAQPKEEKITITYYEIDKALVLYKDKSVVDAVYGGILKNVDEVMDIKIYSEDGREITIVNEGFAKCFNLKYDLQKPDTAIPVVRAWNSLKTDFHKNFIEHDRWLTILNGLWTTIQLTIFALLIGIVLGFIVAFVRCTYDKLQKKGPLLKFFNWLCNVYLTITRGTPVVVQIMIIYFVIFMPIGLNKFLSAVICFGLNSGAYVAEIVRGGIMSIDDGQTEAGRSLGFGYMPTMFHIVFPQAFKAVLPALANEFVVLLKETSIAFYIGLGDLMYAGNAIRAATYSAFMPLVTVAIIYLIMVLALSKLVSLLERKLRSNER